MAGMQKRFKSTTKLLEGKKTEAYKTEWYGSKAKVLRRFRDMQVIDYGCRGKGIITDIRLFPGIQLSLQDMDTEVVFPAQTFSDDIVSINYCVDGRQESEFRDNTIAYLLQHHLSVIGTKFLPVSFSFPLRKYRGISLVLEQGAMDAGTFKILNTFGVDPGQIEEHLHLEEKWFISHPMKGLDHLFREILQVTSFDGSRFELHRLRLKVIELLQYISQMDAVMDEEHIYFSMEQIRKTKQIAEEMLKDPENRLTLEEYAQKHEISVSVFHKIFIQIYGDTPHVYRKKYKMNLACMYLREEGRKISDIALELGYSNPSKFSKAFYSVYGVLPKQYQKENRNGLFL